jgi:hypothetical protein
MIKLIALICRKPGTTREEFKNYYETRHAPLGRRLLPHMADYRRSYTQSDDAAESGDSVFNRGDAAPVADFDVMTEFWFTDQSAYHNFLAAGKNPEIAGALMEDELKFMDRSKIRMFIVDECVG